MPHILIALMISLRFSPLLQWLPQEDFRSRSMPQVFRLTPGNNNQWPCAPGILSCEHLSQDAGSHVTPRVFHQVMNPSGAEWPGWVRSPQLWNALIGCSATLTNLSQQMNGYSKYQSKEQRTGGDGQDAVSPSWWNGRWGLDVRCSSGEVGGWAQRTGGWLCQPISLLTAYLWCVLTRCKGPINSYNMPSVDLLWNWSVIKIHFYVLVLSGFVGL